MFFRCPLLYVGVVLIIIYIIMYLKNRLNKVFSEPVRYTGGPSFFLGFRLFNHKNFRVKKNTTTVEEPLSHELSLKEIFKKEEQYFMILDLLREQKLIAANSAIWIDNAKGRKTTIIALIKFLQIQGYYNVKRVLTYEQIKDIAHNTFGVNISLGLIKHIKFNDIIFKNIPLAED